MSWTVKLPDACVLYKCWNDIPMPAFMDCVLAYARDKACMLRKTISSEYFLLGIHDALHPAQP